MFVNVTVCGAEDAPTSTLPKERDEVEVVMATVPLPVSAVVSVLELDLTVSVPVRAPSTVGVKTTPSVQEAPDATEPQFFEVMEKSPVAAAELTVTAKMELFFHVTVCAAEVKPTGTEPKSSEVRDMVAAPPSLLRLKRLNSSSFSCAVIVVLEHSLGKLTFCEFEVGFST